MKITGTLINYYFHCKRQCWLFYNNVNLEDNSEDVRMGRILHELKNNSANSEIAIDNIKIDKISDKYITEIKKSDADTEAAKKQLEYYMYVLNLKGIKKNGKLEIIEKNKQDKSVIIIEYDNELNARVEKMCDDIEQFLLEPIPQAKLKKGCKKCAYYEYCFI
ncbi:MAG: CRISPR-associated protein Cas4 [Lachnospirales bacterium]